MLIAVSAETSFRVSSFQFEQLELAGWEHLTIVQL
jgi:hypothetical protein